MKFKIVKDLMFNSGTIIYNLEVRTSEWITNSEWSWIGSYKSYKEAREAAKLFKSIKNEIPKEFEL